MAHVNMSRPARHVIRSEGRARESVITITITSFQCASSLPSPRSRVGPLFASGAFGGGNGVERFVGLRRARKTASSFAPKLRAGREYI